MKHSYAALAFFLTTAMALPVVQGHDSEVLAGPESMNLQQFTADLSRITHGSYEVQHILVPSPDGALLLAILEYDLFAPGEKKVQYGPSEDNILYEEELLVWTYQGKVVGDENSNVALTFDIAGIYGTVRTGALRITFEPEFPAMPMGTDLQSSTLARFNGERSVPQVLDREVACATVGIIAAPLLSNCGLGIVAEALPDMGLADVSFVVFEFADVKPYADSYHTSDHGSTAGNTRITDAFNQQHNMWDTYVEIHQTILAIFRSTSNYSTSSTCETHLTAFTNTHSTSSGADAYQLFTGKDLSDCNAYAWEPQTAGTMVSSRDSVIEDTDHSIWDTYDPDEDDDRGLVSAQEIAHNWGEPDHPQDTNGNGCYNVMASGTDHDNRCFFFTSGTISRIESATTGNL